MIILLTDTRPTDVISKLKDLTSVLDIACITCSSDSVLTGIYTMKPRLSRSRDSVFVRGECGEPASTTTSVLAPFFARFALLLALSFCRRLQTMKTPVPTKATTAALTARCSDTQSLDAS